ncbi:MAG: DUF805 domain-containing protein [Akkermansiaceae bacterium]|nr:DUF805 domain-containing protein [Akkermansiaceae bacterium]
MANSPITLDYAEIVDYFDTWLIPTHMDERQNSTFPPVPPVNNPSTPVIVPEPGWFSYSGRYTRAQFWGKWLGCIFLLVIVSSIMGVIIGVDLAEVLVTGRGLKSAISQLYVVTIIEIIVYTLLLLPLLVKRLHDIGVSTPGAIGVWVLMQGLGVAELCTTIELLEDMSNAQSLAAMIKVEDSMGRLELIYKIIRGTLGLVMIVVMCLDSQKGTNLYGPSSKYPDAR